MRTITASEAKQGLAGVLDAAAREPVVIRRHARDVAVVLSMQEYERLSRLNVAEFQRFCDAVGDKATKTGLTEAKLAELLADDA
ncbi:MAG: type II toxin-antitoxin system Phd/YefM family antitoxin [Thermomonas sp.]|uniref:type II toxin-antitoxin system Phd/YefM family antitoxin n=1 Tax=Thermomonas sp. TaxID=1971895 RepID=UPI0039E5BECD